MKCELLKNRKILLIDKFEFLSSGNYTRCILKVRRRGLYQNIFLHANFKGRHSYYHRKKFSLYLLRRLTLYDVITGSTGIRNFAYAGLYRRFEKELNKYEDNFSKVVNHITAIILSDDEMVERLSKIFERELIEKDLKKWQDIC